MQLSEIRVDDAKPEDLAAIIGILADGQLAGAREVWSEESAADYRAVFDELVADPKVEIIVAREGARVVGFILFYFMRAFAGRGQLRAIFHSVFVASDMRGRKVGRTMIAEAEARVRARGATRIDLTSDKRRVDAHRFYRSLGFEQAHEGFKKTLS